MVLAVTRTENGVEYQKPTTRALEFVPVPESAGFGPGIYQLRFQGQNNCATAFGDFPCSQPLPAFGISYQYWAIEPVGRGTGRDVDPNTWSPWSEPGTGDRFTLRSLRDGQCFTVVESDYPFRTAFCNAANAVQQSASLTLQSITDAEDNGFKSPARRDAATAALLGSAFDRAAKICMDRLADNWCKVQIKDQVTGEPITDWSRLGEVTLTNAPTPVINSTSCAGGVSGGGAQTIYNGSDRDLTTTIGASATSEKTESVSTGLSFTSDFSFGSDSLFFQASFSLTVSTEYGKTWTESRTVSQETNWTIPPRRFATAVMSTTGAKMRASWQFGPDNTNPWRANNVVDLTVPYSSNPNATAPDSTMALFNSWSRKDCDAFAPSKLARGRQVGIRNLSGPSSDAAPVIGDVLEAVVGDTADGEAPWWTLPTGDPGIPVTLGYQWYRVQGIEEPQAILGANEPTYTVTGDDIVDPEIIDRVGPYHLFLGVTDLASERRFDSREYVSLLTSSTLDQRPSVAAPSGTLRLSVVNPDAEATRQTRVEVSADLIGSNQSPAGEVEVYAVGNPEPWATVELGHDGLGRAWLPLPAGSHDLFAVYTSATPGLQGVRSANWRTNVRLAESSTWLVAREDVARGRSSRVRVGVDGLGRNPTGRVRLFDGPELVGTALLDAEGMASITLPGIVELRSRQLWASYLGDGVYARSRSQLQPQRVTAASMPTTTVLSAVRRGDVLVFRAQVATLAGQPRGRVRFVMGQTVVGVRPVNELGNAFLRITDLPRRVPDLRARFLSGNLDLFEGSTSPTIRPGVRPGASKSVSEPE